MAESESIKLTQFSKGSGCGCKIAPADLQSILANIEPSPLFDNLIVGNGSNDDAAVIQIDASRALIQTADFFMPIVDDAKTFGKIAAANALSDIYAMGGKPLMSIALLGWPIEQLGSKLAAEVINGAQYICEEAGIPLAGGHSIDSKEPIFGLSATGEVSLQNLKKNSTAQENDILFLTKPLGVGIVATAMKRGKAEPEHIVLVQNLMSQLNKVGFEIGCIAGVTAMTDVTGFGLIGHLLEMCEGSNLRAELDYNAVPVLDENILQPYLKQFIMPDNTMRNFKAFNEKVSKLDANQLQIMCDPQTNGGLLISCQPSVVSEVQAILSENDCYIEPIGKLHPIEPNKKTIEIR